MSGDPYEPSMYWSGNKGYHPPEVVQKLRAEVLVPHGVKCPKGCGSTLVPADPLPHQCDLYSYGVGDYGRCVL